MIRLALVLYVLAEIASLVLAGQAVGLFATLLLVVLAAAAGAALLRRQGGDALRGLRGALESGRDPRPVLRRGGFGLAAALLLLAPGFVSDAAALLLLLPPVQAALAGRAARMARMGGPARPAPGLRMADAAPRRAAPEAAVDADWEEIAPPKRPTHRPSGWTRH